MAFQIWHRNGLVRSNVVSNVLAYSMVIERSRYEIRFIIAFNAGKVYSVAQYYYSGVYWVDQAHTCHCPDAPAISKIMHKVLLMFVAFAPGHKHAIVRVRSSCDA